MAQIENAGHHWKDEDGTWGDFSHRLPQFPAAPYVPRGAATLAVPALSGRKISPRPWAGFQNALRIALAFEFADLDQGCMGAASLPQT